MPSVFDILSLDFALLGTASCFKVVSSEEEAAPGLMVQQHDANDCVSGSDAVDEQGCDFLAVCGGVQVPQAALDYGEPSTVQNKIRQLQTEKSNIQISMDRLQKLFKSKDREIKALQESLPQVGSLIPEVYCGAHYNSSEDPNLRPNDTDTLVPIETSMQSDTVGFDTIDFDETLTMIQDQHPQLPLCVTEEDLDMEHATEAAESKLHRKRKRSSPLPPIKKQRESTKLMDDTTFGEEMSIDNPNINGNKASQMRQQNGSSNSVKPYHQDSASFYDENPRQNYMETTLVNPVNTNKTDEQGRRISAFYERRPKSWPLREAFRQSVDISVKTIVKRFEKLRA